MPYSEEEMVRIGQRYDVDWLTHRADVLAAVARELQDRLGKRFPAPQVDEIVRLTAEARRLKGERVDTREDKAGSGQEVATLLKDAKDWIRDVVRAADAAFQKDPEQRDRFHGSGKIGRSVLKAGAVMADLLVLVQQHAGPLAKWGLDEEEMSRGRQLLEQLRAADTAQEQLISSVPVQTRQLNQAKADLALLLKVLEKTGKQVFRNDPATAARLELGHQDRRPQRREDQPPPPPPA